MPLSGLAQFLLGQQGFSEGQRIGTPGINPNEADPRPTVPNSGISNFLSPLNNPFLLNILAQQGRMTIAPGTTASIPSPLGIIGKAALMTQQQQRQQEQFDLQRKLIESRIKLNEANSSLGPNPSAGNVQSTFEGDNGNMWVITRAGETKDTGVPFSNNVQLVEQADGSVIALDRRTGQQVGVPVSPQQAADATTRKKQTEAAFDLPTDLAALESEIGNLDRAVAKIDDMMPLVVPANVGTESALRGNLPGMFGGDARTLRKAVESLQANLGFDQLQRMRAASKTGGALGQVSERELNLLINALEALDVEGNVEVLKDNLEKVKTHYANYKREIAIMKRAMRKQAGQPSSTPISELSDAELEAIINGNNP